MKISNDYEIRVEQKYYAIFKDVNGIEQKVEVEKEVAEALIQAHRSEKANARYNERYTYTDGVIVLFRPGKYERRIDECNESKSACFKG